MTMSLHILVDGHECKRFTDGFEKWHEQLLVMPTLTRQIQPIPTFRILIDYDSFHADLLYSRQCPV